MLISVKLDTALISSKQKSKFHFMMKSNNRKHLIATVNQGWRYIGVLIVYIYMFSSYLGEENVHFIVYIRV